MNSSLQLSTPYLLPLNKFLYNFPSIKQPNRFNSFRVSKKKQFCSAISSPKSNLEASWSEFDGESNGNFGGWFVTKNVDTVNHNGVPKFVLAGVGASMAVVLAALTYFSFSKKGFRIQFTSPLHSLMPSKSWEVPVEAKDSTIPVNQASGMDDNFDSKSHLLKPKADHVSARENMRIIVPVNADPIQQEALNVLKKLKIIENDARADELCTRREYARWFVKANTMLERNPKHKIVPMILLAGSTISAFDDVSAHDPDFWCIQTLGEAGIVFSKLSAVNLDGQGTFEFFPESFISRFDLVNWKAMLEYSLSSEAKEKVLRMRVGIIDLDDNNLEDSPQLLMDLMAGDKSITRRVFGNIKRLQPQKPVTKAQAAVALISGRMSERIHSELSRLEAENQYRLAEMEDIKSELIQRGEIQRSWGEKLNKEKEKTFEAEKEFKAALLELEKEKIAHDEGFNEYMKDKAALDYQQELLIRLRTEVDGMYERLATEKYDFFAEQQNLEKLFADLRDKKDAIVEAKSILEAEKEAVQILRYWVEEEGRKIQSRGKFLEQATQRWKWNSDA